MNNIQESFETGLKFHGHKCPAMPMGLRAGVAAMKALGVERSKDKELFVEAETGSGHAAGCFLDGVMTATGCTYGKSNIKKFYYNKAEKIVKKIAAIPGVMGIHNVHLWSPSYRNVAFSAHI